MIVKIQVSIATSHNKQQVLVYNKDRSIRHEESVNSEILRLMNGRPKAYFKAKMAGEDIEIQGEVEEQDW